MFIIFSVFYILIAAAMIVLILMQRGQGASAGASFGGGSSGTVFGASGSASFLGRATGALAAVFFLCSLGMAIYLAHSGAPQPVNDLGVMSGAAADTTTDTSKSAPASQSATDVPSATQPAGTASGERSTDQGKAADSDVPTATKAADDDAGASASGKDKGTSGSDEN